MKKQVLILLSLIVFAGMPLLAQEDSVQENSVAASRRANLKTLLDYRYKGGFYSFEKKFNSVVKYPEFARANCVMGIVVMNMIVDCEGMPREIKIKTSLGYGTNEELTKFFESTRGEWNKCEDEKYTRFELPIQFLIKGTETNTTDAIFVCETTPPGHICNDDSYYLKKAQKALEKGHGKKAIKYIDMLLQRDPYNIEYNEMKTQAISLLK